MGTVVEIHHTISMGPLRLVDRIGAHKMERNLSCINAILQMLKSIPEIENIFATQSYKTGCKDNMPICDEISGLFRAKNTEEITAAYLRMLIRKSTVEAFQCFGEQQDLFILFKIISEAVQKELNYSNTQSKNSWEKFIRSQSSSCSNCERKKNCERKGLEKPQILTVSLLEGTNTTVSRLVNSFKIQEDDNEDRLCRFCDVKKTKNKVDQFPDYLLVKLLRTASTSNSIVFPENKMKLLNGETFQLRCIVNHDDLTGHYTTAVIDTNCWVTCDGTEHALASKEDVKVRHNIGFLYVKITVSSDPYQCSMAGCPLDKKLESNQELKRHITIEHPKCNYCKETFLVNCLYKEHLRGKDKCQFAKRQKLKKVTSNHVLKGESSKDSGLESISDSTGEEKLNITKYQVKHKLIRKRKAQCDTNPSKKQKLFNPSVNSKETAKNGKQFCTQPWSR